MSVVQNTLIGRSKQKIGNAVFTTWKGKNVLKSKPLTVENPNTINQQMRRLALQQMVFIYRFIIGVVLVGWKELAIGKSEYNAFTGYNLKYSFDYSAPPVATLNYNDLKISQGSISTQGITSGSSSSAADTVTLNWDASVLQPGQNATDKALIVVVDFTSGQAEQFVTNINRSANTAVVNFSYDISAADNLHVYLGFYNPSTFKAGLSQYINIVAV